MRRSSEKSEMPGLLRKSEIIDAPGRRQSTAKTSGVIDFLRSFAAAASAG